MCESGGFGICSGRLQAAMCLNLQCRLKGRRYKTVAKPCHYTNSSVLLFRPQYALLFFRDRSQALVHEFLQALPAVGFGRVDVAFRIRRDAVHGVELTRLPSAVAETRQNLKSVAQQDVHLLVGPVREIDVLLLRIFRKSNVPNGPVTQRPFFDDLFLDEGTVRLEYLDAVVHTVAHVEQTIVGELGAVHRIAELLIDGRVRIVNAGIGVVRLMTVGAPMPLVLPAVGVKYDHAFVAIAIGDVQFIRFRIDEQLRRTFEVFGIVAALALEWMPNLHQESSILRELQDLIVGIGARLTRFRHVAGPGILKFGVHGAAVPANPDVAFEVDRNSVVGIGPIVTLAGAAPVSNQVASLIEFENGRRGHAAIGAGRIRIAVGFLCFERAPAMNNPDVVLRVHRYANRHSDHPMIRHRLRPHRVHLKHGRLDAGGLHGGPLLQHDGTNREPGNQYENSRTNTEIALHKLVPPSIPERAVLLTRCSIHPEPQQRKGYVSSAASPNRGENLAAFDCSCGTPMPIVRAYFETMGTNPAPATFHFPFSLTNMRSTPISLTTTMFPLASTPLMT